MSKEYIEREAVLNEQMEICHWDGLNDSYDDFVAVKDILAIPAADVVEVRHGEWRYGDKYKTCSLCGATTLMYSSGTAYWNYCPNCGAKMDGGKKQ